MRLCVCVPTPVAEGVSCYVSEGTRDDDYQSCVSGKKWDLTLSRLGDPGSVIKG